MGKNLKYKYYMKVVMILNKKDNIIIEKEDNWYIAKCIDTNVASQGKTQEEAIANLKEAIELYMQNEEPEQPKSIFVTTLEVAI